ncbi:hypothetical protein FB45DRAFT_1149638 [Roridomyces roridus]|uniref:DUF6830 domain-containing protein n=1 Tax=Roridomyces roridus TaxID=1738132 RepID=A0AAD7AZB2_9AGAR|nr:hypothetical protein FB45DRAFT_1149638 [Roridomyces roridus]
MALIRCAGCSRELTKTAYRIHLSCTQDARCIKICEEDETESQPTRDVEMDSESENTEEFGRAVGAGLPLGQTHFDGDYFGGEYTAADLGLGGEDDDADDDADDPETGSGEDSDGEDASAHADLEESFEPVRVEGINEPRAPSPPPSPAPNSSPRRSFTDTFHRKPFVETFPGSTAGAVLDVHFSDSGHAGYSATFQGVDAANPYASFVSKMDWEVARWAKLRGAGSTAFTDLLQIDGVVDALGLSYRSSIELNKIVDTSLPGRPRFERHEIVVQDEVYHLYARNIIDCIRALYGDPDFAPYLFVLPERHYMDRSRNVRMYHNMHTGKWWWATQVEVEKAHPGATIVPIIISSDKTQLTVFGNKSAYPVYMTIGNIPKEIRRKPSRRAYVLLAYLPTSRMKHIQNKSSRRRILANVFHACLKFLTAPLKALGETGMPMASGDGVVRRCHPIFATYVGDYPEQVLVTCTKTGECPTCIAANPELGDGSTNFPLRDLLAILDALDDVGLGSTAFRRACEEAGIKPVHEPFWADLPYTNIFRSITPDILHQLYQGLIKHLLEWVKESVGEAELDARCRRLPPNHNIRLFMKGVCNLSRVTGCEHDQIARFLLGIIIDVRLPNDASSAQLLAAVRGILDFINFAQYPLHTDQTLALMDDALQRFHDNKSVFVDIGVHSHFNLPKLHSCRHYIMYIRLYGTTDNYNTEYTERLHIDLAKDAYRSTNFKDEFPQMTAWLERKEKVFRHETYIQWRVDGCPAPTASASDHLDAGIVYERQLLMAKNPTVKSARIAQIHIAYGASLFRDALAQFITHLAHPTFSATEVRANASQLHLPFGSVQVFHRIKFTTPDPYSAADKIDSVVDSVHIQPNSTSHVGKLIPGRFDTVLVNDGTGELAGTKGYRVAQVRVVFSLSAPARKAFAGVVLPSHLAYVDWFSPFTAEPEPHHWMYKVKRSMKDGVQLSSVIPVANIRRSIHLLPRFGPVAPPKWTSSNVLERGIEDPW